MGGRDRFSGYTTPPVRGIPRNATETTVPGRERRVLPASSRSFLYSDVGHDRAWWSSVGHSLDCFECVATYV